LNDSPAEEHWLLRLLRAMKKHALYGRASKLFVGEGCGQLVDGAGRQEGKQHGDALMAFDALAEDVHKGAVAQEGEVLRESLTALIAFQRDAVNSRCREKRQKWRDALPGLKPCLSRRIDGAGRAEGEQRRVVVRGKALLQQGIHLCGAHEGQENAKSNGGFFCCGIKGVRGKVFGLLRGQEWRSFGDLLHGHSGGLQRLIQATGRGLLDHRAAAAQQFVNGGAE